MWGFRSWSATLDELEERLQAISERPDACLLSIGWGGGLIWESPRI